MEFKTAVSVEKQLSTMKVVVVYAHIKRMKQCIHTKRLKKILKRSVQKRFFFTYYVLAKQANW